jgi:hypothetical protein
MQFPQVTAQIAIREFSTVIHRETVDHVVS